MKNKLFTLPSHIKDIAAIKTIAAQPTNSGSVYSLFKKGRRPQMKNPKLIKEAVSKGMSTVKGGLNAIGFKKPAMVGKANKATDPFKTTATTISGNLSKSGV